LVKWALRPTLRHTSFSRPFAKQHREAKVGRQQKNLRRWSLIRKDRSQVRAGQAGHVMVGDQQPWKIVQVEPCCNGVVEDAYAVTNLAQNNAKGMCNEALIVNNKNIDTRRGLRCHVAILVLSAQLHSAPTGLNSGNRSGDSWVPLSGYSAFLVLVSQIL
jgi:hypothetical protein